MAKNDIRTIAKVRNFNVTMALPGSKSITNRALLLAAMADGPSEITHPLRSDDSEAFVESLNMMGAVAKWSDDSVIIEQPFKDSASGSVNCRDAGTAARFLPPAAAGLRSTIAFDSSEQMRRRPMAQLLDALREQNVQTNPLEATHLPFTLSSDGLRGGDINISGDISSQFLTGLFMAAPFALAPTTFHVRDLVSKPYVDLTVAMMADYGIEIEREGYTKFVIPNSGRYIAPKIPYRVEADASTASYFFAAAVATASRITITNLHRTSLQGDLHLLDIFEQMGATVTDGPEGITVVGPEKLVGVDVDMGDMSDVMMTLACIAPLACGPTHISNVPHARLKESDRISAVAAGMKRLGIDAEEGPDWITVFPGDAQSASVETYEDHRIAMAFSSLGLATGVVGIEDPTCVKKTCPEFFDLLATIEQSGARAL